jgi:sugar O-acyltransferase (sialic acid O-acetyltransferase NeuD family)
VLDLAILGTGGFAREVADILEAEGRELRGWIVDAKYGSPGQIVNGKPILGGMDYLKKFSKQIAAVLGVGSPVLRKTWVEELIPFGVEIVGAIHPSVKISRWSKIGKGVVMAAGCLITPNAEVQDFCQLNMHCIVAHDTVMKKYATLGMGVHLPGNVVVEEGAYLGSGVSIVPPRNIGRWSTVGAGTVLIQDVPEFATVVGNPGRVVKVGRP